MDPFSLDHIIKGSFKPHSNHYEMLKNNAREIPDDLNTRLSTPMDQRRVELLTPALSERCSNQLSYWSS